MLFRVGDFYETFGEDAIKASQVLGITLTKRNNGDAANSELAGFPHHALDTYLHKLVKAGYRVAICDQLEDPKQAKGIVKRGVTELVTPGVSMNDKLLEHASNNFLAAVHLSGAEIGAAFIDISTGEFFVAQGEKDYIDKLLQSLRPAEVVYQRGQQKVFKDCFGGSFYTYLMEPWVFDVTFATETLLKHFGTHSLKGYGVEGMPEGVTAAGVAIHYLKDTEHPNLQHIASVQRIEKDDFLWMDRFTIRNLELFGNPRGEAQGLLQVLDNTHGPMGARLLKRWIAFPLKDIAKIEERLSSVAFLIVRPETRKALGTAIKQCGDVERLVSKVPGKRINPRETLQLAKGLQLTEEIKNQLKGCGDPNLERLGDMLNPCPLILGRIQKEISEAAPVAVSKGGAINDGVDPTLDDLRKIASDAKSYLDEMLQRESASSGISSLKIGYNNVFGYYLEVTNAHKEKVPGGWARKQTLANAERYVTDELKAFEEKILGAEDKIAALESAIYDRLLTSLQDYIQPIQANGNLLAILDCLVCFANNALKYGYKRPILHAGHELTLTESRHPVIERHLPPGETFVPNDIAIGPESQQIIILTGPNMSGKSAVLRQTALIVIMAHIGSFVPAEIANVPLTDKVFTRVGANDNLSGGESTFMVEMNETASIVNNISERSLILLDEIGRGTSTYDGISIAWGIVEYLQRSPLKPKTLFATHYHELNDLAERLEGIANFHVANKEIGNKVIFLRKLMPGGTTHSFGIHVAKMAGMPNWIVDRANEILAHLEAKASEGNTETTEKQPSAMPKGNNIKKAAKGISDARLQLSIFDAHSEIFQSIRDTLMQTDIDRLTPVEALLKLQEIKRKIK